MMILEGLRSCSIDGSALLDRWQRSCLIDDSARARSMAALVLDRWQRSCLIELYRDGARSDGARSRWRSIAMALDRDGALS